MQKLTDVLEKTVQERTAELVTANRSLAQNGELLNEMGKLARVGGWEISLHDMKMHWTDEVYRIHEIEPGMDPTVMEGINYYAPEARPVIKAAVDNAITRGTVGTWSCHLSRKKEAICGCAPLET